jgi:hypothetical protein
VPHTTNHRMEIEAVIRGLAAWRAPCRVERSPDSADVLTRLNGGRARTHHDVVACLLAAAVPHHSPHDVRGHAGHPDHTCADAFAPQAASTGVRSGRRGERERAGERADLPSGRHLGGGDPSAMMGDGRWSRRSWLRGDRGLASHAGRPGLAAMHRRGDRMGAHGSVVLQKWPEI